MTEALCFFLALIVCNFYDGRHQRLRVDGSAHLSADGSSPRDDLTPPREVNNSEALLGSSLNWSVLSEPTHPLP